MNTILRSHTTTLLTGLALTGLLAACGGDDDANNNTNTNNNTNNNAGVLTEVRSAAFVADGAGGTPDATGTARISRGEGGKLYVELGADFKQEEGPGDTQLLLARGMNNIAEQRDADASSVSAVVGTITNGATGAQTFTVPDGVDVDQFDYAIVWCPTAGVNFGAASLD